MGRRRGGEDSDEGIISGGFAEPPKLEYDSVAPGTTATNDGWAWPAGLKKAHYFVSTKALCDNDRVFSGKLLPGQGMTKIPGPGDCVACWRMAPRAR